MEKEDEENGMEKENVPTSQRESSRFPVIDDKTVMSQEEYAQNWEYYQDTVLTETELAKGKCGFCQRRWVVHVIGYQATKFQRNRDMET